MPPVTLFYCHVHDDVILGEDAHPPITCSIGHVCDITALCSADKRESGWLLSRSDDELSSFFDQCCGDFRLEYIHLLLKEAEILINPGPTDVDQRKDTVQYTG
jgi:hypothetical protein